jgi:antitoxin ParD1/3/4
LGNINISLPDDMKSFVDAQVAAGGFTGPNEYVQALIREAIEADRRRHVEDQLRLGLEEIDRNDCREMTAEDWMRLKREYADTMSKRNAK